MAPVPVMVTETLVAKIFGSLSGALLSLVFIVPLNRRDAKRRIVFSVVVGVIFEGAVRRYFSWEYDFEGIMMGACLASATSWFAFGLGMSLIARWATKKVDSGK